jgi:hypothetical protein
MQAGRIVCYLFSLLCMGGILGVSRQVATPGTAFDVDLYGTVFVLNADRNTITQVAKDGSVVREVGGPGWQDGQFDRPAAVWARNGIDVFVADYGNHRIERFDRNLNFISSLSARDNDNPDVRFGYPTAVALSRLGDLFICDGENSRIVKVNAFSRVERTFGGFGAGKGRLSNPTGLELGPNDNVYVLDGIRVAVFDNFGNYTGDLLEGVLKHPAAIFADQQSVAVLDGGILYCLDAQNRVACTIPLKRMPGLDQTDIRSFRFSQGELYVLTRTGVQHFPDPRKELSTGDDAGTR